MTMIRVLAGFAAALTATAVAGCAQPGATPQASAIEPVAAAAVPWQETYAALIEQTSGTPQQWQAAQDRQWYAWQAALGECMVAKGQPFELPAHNTPTAVPNSQLTPGELLGFAPQRADFGEAANAVALAKAGNDGNPALAKTSGAAREAWLAAQDECAPATSPTENLAIPPSLPRVAEPLDQLLLGIQEQAAPTLRADYVACMTAEGVPVSEGVASEAKLAAKAKFPVLTEAEADNPSAVPGWAEAVAFERKAAAADWKCRGPQVGKVHAAVGDKLAVFAEQHRAELAQVAAEWAQMPDERDAAKAAALKTVTQ